MQGRSGTAHHRCRSRDDGRVVRRFGNLRRQGRLRGDDDRPLCALDAQGADLLRRRDGRRGGDPHQGERHLFGHRDASFLQKRSRRRSHAAPCGAERPLRADLRRTSAGRLAAQTRPSGLRARRAGVPHGAHGCRLRVRRDGRFPAEAPGLHHDARPRRAGLGGDVRLQLRAGRDRLRLDRADSLRQFERRGVHGHLQSEEFRGFALHQAALQRCGDDDGGQRQLQHRHHADAESDLHADGRFRFRRLGHRPRLLRTGRRFESRGPDLPADVGHVQGDGQFQTQLPAYRGHEVGHGVCVAQRRRLGQCDLDGRSRYRQTRYKERRRLGYGLHGSVSGPRCGQEVPDYAGGRHFDQRLELQLQILLAERLGQG